MTKKNAAGHAPRVIASDVEEESDRLGIPRDTEDGQLARRMLRTCLPRIIRTFHRRRLDCKDLLTPKQEDDRRRRFLGVVDAMLAELTEEGWAHARWRRHARDRAWLQQLGAEHAVEVAERDVDEKVSAVRTLLTEWRHDMERSRQALGLGAPKAVHKRRNAYEGSKHWLARVSLLIHETLLCALVPGVTARQFVASVFRLAKVGGDARHFAEKARTALRNRAVKVLAIVDLQQALLSGTEADLRRRRSAPH